MLQLIIGITLGIILLFVIMLLITEMASTYPVWKNFEKQAIAPPACHFPEKKEKSRSKRGLLRLSTGTMRKFILF